jgi:hypothetical protein
MSTLNFKNAISDYRLLKNRGYPDKAALKLVADRYRLSGAERNCLLRGVVASGLARTRRAKRLSPDAVPGKALGIDWFNVLITVESFLKGAPLFLADDGVVRDCSGVHGSYRPGPRTDQAIDMIKNTLVRLGPRRVDFFIDSPISHSKLMAVDLEAGFASCPFDRSFALVASADYPLKSYAEVIASSDSVVIDSCRVFIDLARRSLELSTTFRAVPLSRLTL